MIIWVALPLLRVEDSESSVARFKYADTSEVPAHWQAASSVPVTLMARVVPRLVDFGGVVLRLLP